jgi:hypothetical protein
MTSRLFYLPNETSLWRRLLSILFFIACSALAARCQSKDSAVVHANQEVGVSFSPSYIAYSEYSNGVVLDSEHGWIPGFGVKAAAVFNALKITHLLAGTTYDFNKGTSNHCCLPLNVNGGISLTYAAPFKSNDLLFWLGKGFLPTRQLLLTVQGESEYREWLRQLPAAALDTRENYTFWAPGFALGASYSPSSSLTIKGKVGFGYTVAPANAGGGNPNAPIPVPPVTMILGSHPLWRLGGGEDWAITRVIHAYANTDYSRFGFGRSINYYYDDGNQSHHEPSSVTHLVRVNVGLAWSF